MKPLADCKLYTFVDTAYLHGRAPELVAQQLCDGGSDLIQLRAKKSSAPEIRVLAEKILPVTRRANVGLVINDYLEIARDLGAEFCHLGQEDFFDAGYTHVSDIRYPISDIRIGVGLSTHSPEQALRALAAGADYLAIGPIYATRSKENPDLVLGIDELRRLRPLTDRPLVAIGGITRSNAQEVLAAGADSVAVISDLYPEDGNIHARAAEWLSILAPDS